MSNLNNFILFESSDLDLLTIGETINVLTKSPPDETYFDDKFVLVGRVYLQSEYSELFSKIGLIDPSSYDILTEFYVPIITKNFPTITTTQISYLSQSQITTYMRAK
jgi:hypothetical protein